MKPSNAKQKKFITTSIFYANGNPHMGHALEITATDTLNRFNGLNGFNTYFLTGMDEHGQKIQKTADDLGLTPIQLCNQVTVEFQKLYSSLNVTYDRFIRTTEEDHKRNVQKMFQSCMENNDIYLGEYEGWYNPREETFVPEFEASQTNYKDPINNVEYVKMKEPSYFFRLSKYHEPIRKFIAENPDFILGSGKTNEILARLDQQPLSDISISRTTITWGIPIEYSNLNTPKNEDSKEDSHTVCPEKSHSHVFYVWFDALVNYISGAPELGWPADIHVIGKDIVWFHSVIWLGMLLSAKLPFPKQLCVHGFVNDQDGRKMSKSVGNVVSPIDLVEKYPVCSVRYYLLKENFLGDINFAETALIRCNDTELLANLGNLVHRTFSMFHRYAHSTVPKEKAKPLFDICQLVSDCSKFMRDVQIHLYIERIFSLLMDLNTHVNNTRIWEIGNPKFKDARTENDKQEVIRTLLEALYILGHFLQPIIPTSASKIVCDYLSKSFVTFDQLSWNNLDDCLVLEEKDTILFRTLDENAYNERKKKMIVKKSKVVI